MKLTKKGNARRDDLLAYITAYISEHGYSPSIDEMAGTLGTPKSNVHHHLLRLEEEGAVKHTSGVARSWRPS